MKFVIIAQPRCGTSMLVNTLNSIEGFNVYGELFVRTENMKDTKHPQKIQQKMIERYIKNSFDDSKKSVKEFLDDLYKNDNVGFKLLSPHLKRKEGKEIEEYIKRKNIFKILLYRDNKLNQIISGKTSNINYKVILDPKQIVKRLKRFIEEEKILCEKFCYGNYIRKSYEELTGNKDLKEIDLSWFDSNLGIVKVPLRKYKSPELKTRIENYEEFKSYIEKTEFKKWIK